MGGLVTQMGKAPSMLRLSYLKAGEDAQTVRKRLNNLERVVRDLWAQQGEYRLTIERTIKGVQ